MPRIRSARPLAAATLALALAPVAASAPSDTLCVVERQKVWNDPPTAGERFGRPLALDGDTLVVGVSQSEAFGADSGAVAVLVHDGTEWTRQAWLDVPDGLAHTGFGRAVDVDGDRLVAATATPEAVYVLERSGTTWSLGQRLDSPWPPSPPALFGLSLALDGDTLAVGAGNVSGAGAVVVYRSNAGTWTPEALLVPSDGAADDRFGQTVALAGDTLAVGASFADQPGSPDQGAVYVFERAGTTWTETQKLEPARTGGQNLMGAALALDGDTLAAGADLHRVGNDQVGAVYVWRRAAGTWSLEQTVLTDTPTHGEHLGTSVALLGDLLAAGAPDPTYGNVYLFERSGSAWTQAARVAPGDRGGGSSDAFGEAVQLQPGRLIVGSPLDDDWPHQDTGSIFDLAVHAIPGTAFCFGDGSGAACPCGNESPTPERGCESTAGGMSIAGCGTASIAADDLVLVVRHVPVPNSGLFYAGTDSLAPGVALFDGLQCVGGDVRRFTPMFVENVTGVGIATDTGFVAQEPSGVFFLPGRTIHFQYWTRDASNGPSPCGTARNFSPAYAVTMAP